MWFYYFPFCKSLQYSSFKLNTRFKIFTCLLLGFHLSAMLILWVQSQPEHWTESYTIQIKLALTYQQSYHCLTDRVFFFNQVFDPVCQWPYHGLTDQVFHFFFKHIFDPKCQWPHHGLTDRVLKNPVCETVACSLMCICKMSQKKKWKNLVCETMVRSVVDRVKNLIEKKDPVCQTVIWSLAG